MFHIGPFNFMSFPDNNKKNFPSFNIFRSQLVNPDHMIFTINPKTSNNLDLNLIQIQFFLLI